MSLTNLVLLSSTLLTNHQARVVTNASDHVIVRHVETVMERRIQGDVKKVFFGKSRVLSTNVVDVARQQKVWDERIEVLNPKPVVDALPKSLLAKPLTPQERAEQRRKSQGTNTPPVKPLTNTPARNSPAEKK